MLAFVLGGGGSRGALQVGALKVLVESGIVPDMVIGTSVGSVNGVVFASNPTITGLEKLEKLWLQMDDAIIYPGNTGLALLRFIRGQTYLYSNEALHNLLLEHLPCEHFNELALPCYAVAVDLDNGEIVAFGDDGSARLEDGLMSSMALVPAHPPWTVGKRRFIDGGYGAVVPVRQAIERGATRIIAFDLSTPSPAREEVQSAFSIMQQASDLLARQQKAADLAYAAQQVEFIKLDLFSDANIPLDDFSFTAERIEKGRKIATAALAQHDFTPPAVT